MLAPLFLVFAFTSAAVLDRSWQYDIIQPVSSQQWPVVSPTHVKKYDRNCFFSPVQCMMVNYHTEDPIVITNW